MKSILSPRGIVQEREALESFNTDWIGKYRGNSSLVLKPYSTEQVSQVSVSSCVDRFRPIVCNRFCVIVTREN